MSFDAHSAENTTTQNFTVKRLDNKPIKWDGNPAHVLGILHDVGEYFRRTHAFKALFEHRAAIAKNGKMVVSSKSQVPFIIGMVTDPVERGFESPCPPVADRIAATQRNRREERFNAVVTDLNQTVADNSDQIIIQPYLVDEENGKLHETLLSVINDTSVAKSLACQSLGDGLSLLNLMRNYETNARESDKSLVINNYNLASSKTIASPMSMASLDAWLDNYEQAKAFVPATSRKNDASEVELINLLAFRDETVQTRYELECRAASTAPTTMAAALTILRSIIRSREVYHQITGVTPNRSSLDPTTSQQAMLTMLVKSQQALLTAINAGMLVKPDPNKNKKALKGSGNFTPHRDLEPVPHPQDNGKWDKPERDSTGRITRWLKGMEPCRLCYKNTNQFEGHLYRDCPLSKQSNHKAAAAREVAKQSDDSSLSELLAQFNELSNNGVHLPTHPASTEQSMPPSQPFQCSVCDEDAAPDDRCHPPTQATIEQADSSPVQPGLDLRGKEATNNKLSTATTHHISLPLEPHYGNFKLSPERSYPTIPITTITKQDQQAINIKQTSPMHRVTWARQLTAAGVNYHSALPASKRAKSTDALHSTHHNSIVDSYDHNGNIHVADKSGRVQAFMARIDSCCTNHATYDRSMLINVRKCDETFEDANGNTTQCTEIGDLPVILMLSDGTLHTLTISNVIVVPTFVYHLLSVTQLFREQRITARFGDNMDLQITDGESTRTAKFAAGSALPAIPMLAVSTLVQNTRSYKDISHRSALISSRAHELGYHHIKSTSHLAKLNSSQLGNLMHRRWHVGIDKIRAAAHTSADGIRSLASATQPSCSHCAKARITTASHPSTMRSPAAEPGVLHVDLIDMASSPSGGFNYAALFVDEYSRYIFIRFLRRKSDIQRAAKEVIAEFDSKVGFRSDRDGNPLPRPQFRRFHSDHEGGLESKEFAHFEAETGKHHTFSPPHDHNLNPIAERAIRTIRELAAAISSFCNAPAKFWPWVFAHATDIHNSTIGSVGSSPAYESISPGQRFTLKPEHLMDIGTFGCKAVILLPSSEQSKRSLTPRGVEGIFLGRSRRSIGAYDVLVGDKVRTSSSIQVNEEVFPWRTSNTYEPIATSSTTPSAVNDAPTSPAPAETAGSPKVDDNTASWLEKLHLLSLFSGKYTGDDNLRAVLYAAGWKHVIQRDNDAQEGGGWEHDILNDATYADMLLSARAGKFDAVMLAPPCSTFSLTRFFTPEDGSDGPPPVRTSDHPDGLPLDQLPTKHVKELKTANLIISRMVEIAIAAHHSTSNATIILENPADRKDTSSPAHDDSFPMHGSLFDTKYFKKLAAAVNLKKATFAYCRLGSAHQKYTTLCFTADASSVLDALNSPEYQCNHPWGFHAKLGGIRDKDGRFNTAAAAAYPKRLNAILARAFTVAAASRHSPSTLGSQSTQNEGRTQNGDCTRNGDHHDMGAVTRNAGDTSRLMQSTERHADTTEHQVLPDHLLTPTDVHAMHPESSDPSSTHFERAHPQRDRTAPNRMNIGDTAVKSYQSAAVAAEEAVASLIQSSSLRERISSADLHPISCWAASAAPPTSANRISHNTWMTSVDETTKHTALHTALRADSHGAPETHAQAADDPRWLTAEQGELKNHAQNGSFTVIPLTEVPRGRKIHKLVWVYKIKRDGTYKARLCVQGCTMEHGVDYDQVFSSTLRYSSARSIFAIAARFGLHLRSVDLTAAYLQGAFIDKEVVYCRMPPGYETHDKLGHPNVIRVDKPIYGIPQSGRRLQRPLIEWFKQNGFTSLADADPCVFYRDGDNGERVIVGCYVDNLQIASSVPFNDDGSVPQGTILHEFYSKFSADWDIVDEGPLVDLLGIELLEHEDGSITIHQSTYISKMIDRFMPNGVPKHVQKNSVPYSDSFLSNMVDALSKEAGDHPELVKAFQQRVGSLMYCCTATRPDITYVVHQLCKCMQKPTPALMRETDHVFAYLYRSRLIGLTFEHGDSGGLNAFSDASWDVHRSTSGYVVRLGRALVSWGSKSQHCTALSSAESEMIALSEAAKEVVYQRKWFKHLTPQAVDGPTSMSTDNKAARDVSYNPEHFDRMKHVSRRHFFIRDMVEAMELSVPLVRTDENIADFLTKPLPPKSFYRLRAIVMNERNSLGAATTSK